MGHRAILGVTLAAQGVLRDYAPRSQGAKGHTSQLDTGRPTE